MTLQDKPSGLAALSICEALLLAIYDHKLLPETEIIGLLRDAAATHENAARITGAEARNVTLHEAAATLINRITLGGTSGSRR